MGINDKLAKEILLFDGAMGTMLQKNGLPSGGLPELYNLTHPEVVLSIHKSYVEAGADVVSANTFQANTLKIPPEYSVEEIIDSAVRLAKKSGAPYVALDVGPLGQLLKPLGSLSVEDAYEYFKQQMIQGEKSGADCIIIETFSDLLEAKTAILAAKENTSLPVFCTLSFEEDGRTFMGTDPMTAVIALEGLGIDALGVNCSLGPKELMPIVDTMLEYSHIPVMVQANAGLPEIVNGETTYTITPEDFVSYTKDMLEKGVAIVGGCCGTDPRFIKLASQLTTDFVPVKTSPKNITAVSSGMQTSVLEGVTIIGERINPTGKKALKEALINGRIDYILGEAIDQTEAGSDILDVNVGLPDIDEAEMQKKVVSEIQGVTRLPLQIDSADPKAIEAGVRIYNGKPLINSVNGKQDNMDLIFPIVKKYGAAVVGLTLDESGIPPTAEGRFAIAEKLLKTALEYGIPKENLLIDCLVLTVSAQQENTMETLKAIKLVKAKLGLKTVLGVSNVSFGLPSRSMLNATFLAAAFGAGLDAPILNPMSEEYMKIVDTFKVLNNQDKNAEKFIEKYSAVKPESTKEASALDLNTIILQGRKDESAPKVVEMLASGITPLEIIEGNFVPALNKVGKKFEDGTLFLPQLIQSAEAVKAGFGVIKTHMESKGLETEYKGSILLATVLGDIHDIGKNIVAMILENYGYKIFDLGKDVAIEEIVETVKRHNIELVGLSALMTTTVHNMKATITALRDAGLTCKVMVGGAVLNEEYTKLVGADYYGKDAMESVVIAERFFGK